MKWPLWKLGHPNWPIAIDLGADGVRMLQLTDGESRPTVYAGARWAPSRVDGEAPPHNHILRALREMLAEGGFAGRRAVASVPSEDVAIRNVRLPDLSPMELPFAVLGKAHEVFEDDMALSRLSVIPSGPISRGDACCQEYILIAVPSYAIEARQDLLAEAGLQRVVLEAEPISLFRSYRRLLRRQSDRSSLAVLLHVSTASTVVLVTHGSRLLFVKNIQIGERQICRSAAEHLGLRWQDTAQLRQMLMREYAVQAQALGRLHVVSRDGRGDDALLWTVHDAVRSEIEKLVHEVGLCLRYCTNTFSCPKIDQAILTSGAAWDPSLVLMLSESLGLLCQPAEPMRNIETSTCDLFADRRNSMTDWAIAMGLANRDAMDPIDQADRLMAKMDELEQPEGEPL